jgi:two-component system, OmpR family, sensor histidine kinase BaeS
MPAPRRLRTRLLLANLLVVFAALGSVLAAVSLVGPGYFAEAMGHAANDPHGQQMDAATLAAFQEAMRTALVAATMIALAMAVAVSVAVSLAIARPVTRLAAAAQRVAAGQYAERVPLRGRDELAGLGASFNMMADSLEATERRRLQLVGDVAHELRTPLATLDGYLEGLQDGVIAPEAETWRLLRGETSRLTRLVSDLQELWRAEAHQLPLHIGEHDVAPLVQGAAERSRPAAGEKQMTIALAPGIGGRARVDPDRLAQILDNYLSNAIRYSPPGSTITLGAGERPGEVVLWVGDEGRGLTADQQRLLFERFYRPDPSRSRALGGAGVGLAIVRALAEAMGGRAWVESAGPGRGSVFHVALRAATGA